MEFDREKMRERREALGMTQEQLARMLAVTHNYIYMLEKGRKIPGINMINDLSQALKIDPLSLLIIKEGGENNAENPAKS